MYGLKNRAHSSDTPVDVGISEEVRRQVAVKPSLYCCRRVDPQRGVEQYMVQKLPSEKGLAERLRLAQTLRCPMVDSEVLSCFLINLL